MLKIVVPARESWDEKNNVFVETKETELCLEHSLVSISKWEAKWNKPFLSKDPHTEAEVRDYIRCMTITQNVDPNVYNMLTADNFEQINNYINAPMTATTFRENPNQKRSSEIITAEIVYYWMIALDIPFECQRWHFNRLMTLIRVCSIKNQPSKKMSKRDIIANNASLNAQRRAKLGTKG